MFRNVTTNVTKHNVVQKFVNISYYDDKRKTIYVNENNLINFLKTHNLRFYFLEIILAICVTAFFNIAAT